VQLKGVRKPSTFDVLRRRPVRSQADRIYFVPTSETERWRDELREFNDFLAKQNIDVPIPDDVVKAWTDKLNEDEDHSGALFYKPELFRNSVYRVFNDGRIDDPRFDNGGRLAGGWWMNAPREVRPFIMINGQPTTELDYEACHPRMLYHERGLECLLDPYIIPEVSELYRDNDLTPLEGRAAVKWIFKSLINGKRRPSVNEQPSEVVIPTGMSPAELSRVVERNHESISEAFWSGAGKRLMRKESDIALSIVTQATIRERTALPIHDSFISSYSNEEELTFIMNKEYQSIMNHQPTIIAKRTHLENLLLKGTASI
jgi:hypothetical protein